MRREAEKHARKMDRNNGNMLRNMQRDIVKRQVLAEEAFAKSIGRGSMVFQQMLNFDDAYFKYSSGYYGYAFRHTLRNFRDSAQSLIGLIPTPREALWEVYQSVGELAGAIYYQPYAHIVDSAIDAHIEVTRMVTNVVAKGPWEMFASVRSANRERHYRSEEATRARANRAKFVNAMEKAPLIRWLRQLLGKPLETEGPRQAPTGAPLDADTAATAATTTPASQEPLWRKIPILVHMANVISVARSDETVKLNVPSFWNMDLHVMRAYSELSTNVKWAKPKWTAAKSHNYAQFQRMVRKITNRIFPDSVPAVAPPATSRELQLYDPLRATYVQPRDPLIFTNCRIFDETIDILGRLFGYCTMEFLALEPNVRDSPFRYVPVDKLRVFLGKDWEKQDGRYKWEAMPMSRDDPNARKFCRRQPDPVVKIDPCTAPMHGAELAPHIKHECEQKRLKRELDPRIIRKVQYFRATPATAHPVLGGFDLHDWIIEKIEQLFDLPINSDMESIVGDIKAFVTNPNRDIHDYPDVGLAFWIIQPVTCNFPYHPILDRFPNNNNNLDCGIGIGLEAALGKTIVWAGLGLLGAGVISFIIPGSAAITFPIILLGFGIVTVELAWFYSPGCLFLTPTLTPIPFPALPQCAMNEIVGLLRKYIAKCYDFLIPDCWHNGPVCLPCTGPASATRIAFISCRSDVYMSNGIQALLYIGDWIFGIGFHNFMNGIAALPFVPQGVTNYIQLNLANINLGHTSPTQECRLRWCFWVFGVLSIAPVIAGFLFLGPILNGLFIASIRMGMGLWRIFETSIFTIPLGNSEWTSDLFPEEDYPSRPSNRYSDEDEDGQPFSDNEDDDDDDDDDNDKKRRKKPLLQAHEMRTPWGFASSMIDRLFIGRRRKLKRE